ncbi:hypothetical protein M1105_13255 [Limibaculum sp. FT325]|uniref:hypothetical protein n=1 Tax=Thermohalobaculum sediminis TaxID=2939436 RepID=UPI0020C0C580|nr:hypothetical protein [Limibaculum sediminis]MCL5777950.1 hypothetical protein [Limibaculum sediminis]
MSSSSITFSTGHGVPGFSGVMSAIVALAGSLRRAQAAAAEFERLNALSDRALARDGLSRTDIARVVMERHFG